MWRFSRGSQTSHPIVCRLPVPAVSLFLRFAPTHPKPVRSPSSAAIKYLPGRDAQKSRNLTTDVSHSKATTCPFPHQQERRSRAVYFSPETLQCSRTPLQVFPPLLKPGSEGSAPCGRFHPRRDESSQG